MADKKATDPAVAEALSAAVSDDVAAQVKEYSTFVATQQIWAGTALAYNEGDAVPVSNVELHSYEQLGWVKRV